MSARFVANFISLLLGAAVLIFLFAFGRPLADWVAVGAGVTAILVALYSFASVAQGVYQRIADVLICALGAWAIVAARVFNDTGDWLIFGAGAGLLGLGAIGLVVREIDLASGLQVGESRIGPDEFARLATLQGKAEARR
jgi:hypothetical protein